MLNLIAKYPRCAVIAFFISTTPALASPSCDQLNALGRVAVSTAPGGTISLGPFSQFDEGIHEQPADGDTIRISRVGDVSVEISYRSNATDTQSIVPPGRFSNHVIASPGSPENAPMTIVIRTLATTDPTPEVAVSCLNTPNPGRDPVGGTPSVPATQADAVVDEVSAEMAQELSRMPTTPADLPSILTTPAPGVNPNIEGFERFLDRMDRRYVGRDRAAVETAIDGALSGLPSGQRNEVEALLRGSLDAVIEAYSFDIDRVREAEQLARDRRDWRDLRSRADAWAREKGLDGWSSLKESDLTFEDLTVYQDYLQNPDPLNVSRADAASVHRARRAIAGLLDGDTLGRIVANDARRGGNQGDDIGFDIFAADDSVLYNRDRQAGRVAEVLDARAASQGVTLGRDQVQAAARAIVDSFLDNPNADPSRVIRMNRARAQAQSGNHADAAAILNGLLNDPATGARGTDAARGRFYGTRAFGSASPTFDGDLTLNEGETVSFLPQVGSNVVTLQLDSAALLAGMRHHALSFSEYAGAGLAPRDHRFWLRGRLTLHDGRSQGMDGRSYEIQTGAVFKLDPKTEAGAFLTMFRSDLDTVRSGTQFDTEGLGLGIYLNRRLSRTLVAGLSATLEDGDTSKRAGAVVADYGYSRQSVAASLSGTHQHFDWLLSPSMSLGWSRRVTQAHVDSVGTVFAKRRTKTLNLSAALSATRTRDYVGRRYTRLTESYRVAAHYYDRKLPAAAATASDPAAGMELGLSWRFDYRNNNSFSFGAALGGIGQDTRTLSFDTTLDIPF